MLCLSHGIYSKVNVYRIVVIIWIFFYICTLCLYIYSVLSKPLVPNASVPWWLGILLMWIKTKSDHCGTIYWLHWLKATF